MADHFFYPDKRMTNGYRSISRAIDRKQITQEDSDLILEYIQEYQASRHVKDHRALKTLYDLVNWRRFISKPYSKAGAKDIYSGITAMENGKSLRGGAFKQNTKHDYVKALKAFLFWLIENKYSKIPDSKVRAIKIPEKDMETVKADEILTKGEVGSIVSSCRSTRDKAIVVTLYETGARVGELARLRWRDIKFDKYGVAVRVTDTKATKGGKERYSRLSEAAPYLAAWKTLCPNKKDDDFVFYSNRAEPMEYKNLSVMLQRTAARAGITKKIRPHLLRHSRITHLVQQNYQESIIKKTMWGNLNTRMFRTYVSLSEKDIDKEFLRHEGVDIEAEEQPAPREKARPCPNCHTINQPQFEFCWKCGSPLTEEVKVQQDTILDVLKEMARRDPEGLVEALKKL